MAGIRAQLTGFGELQERLERAKQEVPGEVAAELKLAAMGMRDGARASAADQQLSGTGHLLISEIGMQQSGPLSFDVFSNAEYSGYVEFGTRSRVQIPAGLEEVAAQIKGSTGKSSVDVKHAIFEWCRIKGIEKQFWWPIFIKIMTVGSNPHPFFFKQLEAVQPELLKNLENILEQI